MTPRPALLALLLLAAPAHAAERSFGISGFERIRVEGPYAVTLTTGRAPAARASGDPRALDDIDIHVDGTSLVVRTRPNDGGPRRATAPVAVVLATHDLRTASVLGGGALTISGAVAGQRVDLAVNGSGMLRVAGLAADQLNVTLIGTGSVTLGGRAARARLVASGAGTIAATALNVDDLIVRLDGTGQAEVSARRTADVATTGIGGVTVRGTPACTVRATGGGPIVCGK